MKETRFDKNFLKGVSLAAIILLPFFLRKQSLKEGLLAFLLNGITNNWLDFYLVSHKKLEYPIRLFPKLFKINIAFDFLLYPTVSVLINKVTQEDGFFRLSAKVFGFIIGIFAVELWAVKKTSLIRWKNGWNWYHTIGSMVIKSILNVLAVRIIKKMGTVLTIY